VPDPAAGAEIARFGLVTDVHYADKDTLGDRNYRDGDSKLADAVTAFNADGDIDFVMQMADFIDGWDNGDAPQNLTDLGVIEAVYDNMTADRYYSFGNHDLEDISKADFYANTGMTEGYCSFDAGDLHVVVLDAMNNSDADDDPCGPGNINWGNWYVNPAQRTWLTNDLAETSKETIVFCHFRLEIEDGGGYYVANADAVRAILEASGKVRHVFSGHKHVNAHSIVGTIGYHAMEAMTENAYPENAFSIVKVYDNGWVVVTGTDRQESYSYAVPIC